MPPATPAAHAPPTPGRWGGLFSHLANIYHLTVKELRSIRADPMMLVLVLAIVLVFIVLLFEFLTFAAPLAILASAVLSTSGVLLALLASLGPAIWTAAIVVKYRDFRFVIPFVLQFGLYVSPVGFQSTVVPEQWRLLYNLNPMVGIIDGFRWCIVGGESPIYLPGFVLSLVVTAAFLWIGVSTFRRIERGFADLI